MSQTKITALTTRQQALLPIWHDRWLKIGMSDEPTDKERATRAIAKAYATIGKNPPPIVWCDSPATCNLGIAAWPKLFSGTRASLCDSLHASLGASLHASLHASLGASLHASLGDSLHDSLGASLCDSLHASLRASLHASLRDSLHASLGDSLCDSLHASLHDSLHASLHASLRASLHASLGDSLHDSLHDSLRASLRDSLHDSLRASLRASLGDSLRDSLCASLGASLVANYTYFWGQYDAYWIAFYLFCREIGVKYESAADEKIEVMSELAQSCGWIYFYEYVCFVSARPKTITKAEQRNGSPAQVLHCSDRPAMEFRDGWKIYAWRGVRIAAEYYEAAVNPHQILAEQNAEVRRALMERYDEQHGNGRFIQDCGAKVLDQSLQPMRPGEPDAINELLTIDLPGDPEGRMVALKVTDPSTGRVYILRVPPDQKSVRGALAWSFNVPAKGYVLQQES